MHEQQTETSTPETGPEHALETDVAPAIWVGSRPPSSGSRSKLTTARCSKWARPKVWHRWVLPTWRAPRMIKGLRSVRSRHERSSASAKRFTGRRYHG